MWGRVPRGSPAPIPLPTAAPLSTPSTSLSFAALALCRLPWFDARVYGLGSAAFSVSYVALQVGPAGGAGGGASVQACKAGRPQRTLI
jgi:hypothetical protein